MFGEAVASANHGEFGGCAHPLWVGGAHTPTVLSGQGHVPLSQLGGGSGTEQLSYGRSPKPVLARM